MLSSRRRPRGRNWNKFARRGHASSKPGWRNGGGSNGTGAEPVAVALALDREFEGAAGADLAVGLEAEKAAFARVFASQDAREGTEAFVEKRAPRFAGN